MMGNAFNIIVTVLGMAIAASSIWGALNIMRAYKEMRESDGAFLLTQARNIQSASKSKKTQNANAKPSRLSSKLEQAGIPLSAPQWIGVQVASCLLCSGSLLALGISNTGTEGLEAVAVLALLATGGVILGYRQFVAMRIRRRLLLLEKQLAQVELQIAENSRSGLPVSRSILACSELVDEPLRGHLRRMHAELTYSNLTLAEGFENMAQRTGSADARLLASVISVQQQTGSNLADALGFLHETLSRRTEMRQTLRSALAETRITRNIVAVTPWAIFLLLAFAPFVKIQGFWEFYAQNPLGHMILMACIAVELGILFLISRLSNLKLE